MIQLITSFGYFIYLSFLYSALIFFVAKRSKAESLNPTIALDVSLILMVSGFVGARFLHVVWEAPFYYRDHFVEVFKFWNGGFVFYGGAIAVIFSSVVYVKIKKENFWTWADFFTPFASIGYAFGRLSCLISGCCYGKTCELYLPFTNRHPTQIYASLFELFNFALILIFRKKLKHVGDGLLFLCWTIFHALGRLLMEYFREDFRGSEILNVSLGTLTSISIIVVSIIFILNKLYRFIRKLT